MFIDISPKKVFILIAFFIAIVLSVTIFVAANTRTGATARFSEHVSRSLGAAEYWLQFKLPQAPEDVFAALAGGASASRPTDSIAEGIPVLLYHGEGQNSDMPEAVFVAQMRALKAAGWQTITMSQFRDFMKGGAKLPEKSFLLTFDDGRRDTFYATDPVLQDLGFHAVMFVITGFSMPGNGNTPLNNFYLSKSELEYMEQSGRWDLESHGDADHWLYDIAATSSVPGNVPTTPGGHFVSNLFWLSALGRLETPDEYGERITNDLMVSKRILETDFSKPVDSFAFPYNDYGQDSLNYPPAGTTVPQAAASVYSFGFIQVDPTKNDFFNYSDPNAFFLKRIEPAGSWSAAALVTLLEKGEPHPLPFSATSFGAEWEETWGSVTPKGNGLALAAAPDTTGAATVLLGSESWRNYSLKGVASLEAGEFSLLARVNTSGTFLSCTLTPNRILIEEKTSNSEITIASAPYTPPAGSERSATLYISGANARCDAYGAEVAATTNITHSGNAGFQVWAPQNGAARATVTSVRADAL